MQIKKDIIYVGVVDKNKDLFEGQYKVPGGVTYNSYAILDEKVAIMDTTDNAFCEEWLTNVENALGGRDADYLIVQHMEPDHSANITSFVNVFPEAKIVSSAKSFSMMKLFIPLKFQTSTCKNQGIKNFAFKRTLFFQIFKY